MDMYKKFSFILSFILIITCIPISSNGANTSSSSQLHSSLPIDEENTNFYTASNKIKTKKYTISKQAGMYSAPIKIKIKAKKGYKIFYSLNGKFKAKKVIKSKKKKTITISSTKTLQIYAVKSSKKITNKKLKAKAVKKCKNYTYTIQRQTNENSGDSINSSDNKNNLDNEKNNNIEDQDNPKQDIENDCNNPSEENTSSEGTTENTPDTGTTEESTTIDLTIDQKDFSTEDENITLSGTYDGDIKKLTYKVVFGKSEEITNGNISYSENKWSLELNNLKIGENNITITAIDQNGKEISKSVQVILEGLYEYSQDDIVTDEETGVSYIKNTILIFFEEDLNIDKKNEIIDSISGTIIGEYSLIDALFVRIPETDYQGLKNIVNFLENTDGVITSTIDLVNEVSLDSAIDDNGVYPADGVTDYRNKATWYEEIKASELTKYQSNPIDVGVLDEGITAWHEDLNLIDLSNISSIEKNHGTHVAGIIGAKHNNYGIDGVLANCNIFGYDCIPEGYQESYMSKESSIVVGMVLCINKGAKVINFSISRGCERDDLDLTQKEKDELGNSFSKLIYVLKKKFHDIIIVQSAGNGHKNAQGEIRGRDASNGGSFTCITEDNCYRGDDFSVQEILDSVIIVGNAEKYDGGYQLTIDSNGGERVDITAPGQDVFSTVENGYAYKSGTSMAAPMVTAAAAGIWSMSDTLSSADVKEIILDSADLIVSSNPDAPNAADNGKSTYRFLNIENAVNDTLKLLKGTVSGQVMDENSNPIDNVTIEIYDEKDNTVATLYTDENGDFSITLPENVYSIKFVKSGYSSVETSITVERDKITALLDPIIMIANDIGIRGKVVDDAGAPLSEVLIEIKKSNTEDIVTSATTDENGEYSITLENGGYDITFSKDGYDSATLNDVAVFDDISKLNEVVMNATTQTIFSGGDGSKENPYQITNEEEFREIANYPNDYFILMNDLDLSDSPRINEFNGTFDGNGKTVKPGLSSENGLFIDLKDNAVVKNLIINIGYNTEMPDDGFYGSLAIRNWGLIEKCQVRGTIYSSSSGAYLSDNDFYLGGLVAILQDTGIISKCRNSIYTYIKRKTSASIYWGGIAERSSGQIKDCLVDGSCYITHYTNETTGYRPWTVLGGIVAESGSCSDCVVDATIQISHLSESTNYHLSYGVFSGFECNNVISLPSSIAGLDTCYVSDSYSLNVTHQYYGSGGGMNRLSEIYTTENITNSMVMPHEEVEEWYNAF